MAWRSGATACFAIFLSIVSHTLPAEATDCNSNFIEDRFEILTGSSPDCNHNLVPDSCDLNPPTYSFPAGAVSFSVGPHNPPAHVTSIPIAIAAADFDQDNDVDLVTMFVVNGTSKISVMLQTAVREYEAAIVITLPSAPQNQYLPSIQIGKFDPDRYPDIVIADRGTSSLLFLQNSDGQTLSPPVATPLGFDPTHIVSTDFDQDTDRDLYLISSNPRALHAWQNNSLQFSSIASTETLPGASVTDLDLNPSTSGELFIWVKHASTLASLLRTTLQLPNKFSALSRFDLTDEVRDESIADFDNDGQSDFALITRNPADGARSLTLAYGTNDGSFLPVRERSIETDVGTLAVGDLNHDGLTDLLLLNNQSSILNEVFNTGSRSFASGAAIPMGDGPTFMIAEDLDRDSAVDIAMPNFSQHRGGLVSLLFGGGSSGFDTGRALVKSNPLTPPKSAATADIDRDGDLDFVMLTGGYYLFSPGALELFINDGSGNFTSQTLTTASFSAQSYSLEVIDLNGDSLPEIVIANSSESSITLYKNNGSLNFESSLIPSVGFSWGLVIKDLDHDLLPDIATADRYFDRVSVLYNRGALVFDSPRAISPGKGPIYIAATDINLDGQIDIITANNDYITGRSALNVNLGVGNRIFGPSVRFEIDHFPRALIVNELSGDILPDVAVATSNNLTSNFQVSVLLGDAISTFQPVRHYPVARSPVALLSTDLNRDGSLDLLALSEASRVIGVLTNSGAGLFSLTDELRSTESELSLLLEINADNDPNSEFIVLGRRSGVVLDNAPPLASLDLNIDGIPDECQSGQYSSGGSSSGSSSSSAPTDSDRDGVLDEIEILDGTDPTDSGSFSEHLNGSAFGLWSGFLDLLQVLELVNTGDGSALIAVELVGPNGESSPQRIFQLGGNNQQDIALNTLPGFNIDSHGAVRINFIGSIAGRITSYYRNPKQKEEFDFVYAVPLAIGSVGQISGISNTFLPFSPEAGDLSLNWLSLTNLSAEVAHFTVETFRQNGEKLEEKTITVEPWARRDSEAGLGTESSLLHHRITPSNLSGRYLGYIVRYLWDARGETYRAAIPIRLRSGNGRRQVAPITSMRRALNWLEVLNSTGREQRATLAIQASSGEQLLESTIVLAPFAQEHFNASSILGNENHGYALLVPTQSNSLQMNSAYYYQDPTNRTLAGGGLSLSSEPRLGSVTSSYNLFLGSQNWLKLFNPTSTPTAVSVSVFPRSGPLQIRNYVLQPQTALDLNLHGPSQFGTLGADTYGIVRILSGSAPVYAELWRLLDAAHSTGAPLLTISLQ